MERKKATSPFVKRWRRRMVGLALIAVCGGPGGWSYHAHPAGVDWVQYSKLRRGMTWGQVIRLLGRPSGCDLTPPSVLLANGERGIRVAVREPVPVGWQSEDNSKKIYVIFGRDDRAKQMAMDPDFMDWLRRRVPAIRSRLGL